MELGQRIRQARLETGLSQRQLCGDTITRNMLSRIENGAVRPSMTTLRFLAEALGKPVSYFLDETAVTSPNVERMAQARQRYEAGEFAKVLELLEDYQQPDEIFAWEKALLQAKCYLSLASQAIGQDRLPYGAELLNRAEQAGKQTPYFGVELERERLLLLAQVETDVVLLTDDRALLLRAKQAMAAGDEVRCAAYLDAAEEQETPEWNFLRGEAYFALKDYEKAVNCFLIAEYRHPKETARRLEECYRALEDYKMAYHYACKQREK